MKKLIALAFATLATGSAFAQVMSITHDEIGSVQPAINQTVYDSIGGPYSAFASGAFAQNDDYQANLANTPYLNQSTFQVTTVKFVGGVSAVGGTLDFFFLDAAGANVFSSFSATLGSAGDFIWTITLNPGFYALTNGRLQIQNRTGTSGRWFFTTTAPVTGTNDINVGTPSLLNPKRYQAFQIQAVPEPCSMLAIGTGVVALVARRRRNRK
jgi:hypothetical protein